MIMLWPRSVIRHRQSVFHHLETGILRYLQKGSTLYNGHEEQVTHNKQWPFRRAISEQSQSANQSGSESKQAVLPSDDDPAETYQDDDSLRTVLLSAIRFMTCFFVMLVTTIIWTFILFTLLPFPSARIKQSNVYGHITGRLLMWILGNPLRISGAQNANLKAIYICNHASLLDIILVMWLIPIGTVGIAKKEVIWYPLFGQLYLLANHIRIDRANSSSSVQSFQKVAKSVIEQNLSLIVFPEGTRSATGRLLPFKKGFVHLAIQTKYPIVPMVLTGTHLGWQKNSLRVRQAPLSVTFLPPIKTDDWTTENVEKYLHMVHSIYAKHLPLSQKPLKMGPDCART